MLLCMRATVELPDSLMDRVKACLATRKLTFRALVISALEQALEEDPKPFKLSDASVGGGTRRVSSTEINRAINEQREPSYKS